MMLILQGCATELLSNKLNTAENKLSHGKPADEDLKKGSAPVLPPSVAARYKLALIMDSFIKGESTPGAIGEELKKIREDSFTPYDQKIEAGYLIILIEKMEILQKSLNAHAAKNRECSKESEELKKAYEQIRKDSDDLKKENDLLAYKLKKLEEIHIQTEKRRGTK
jgi:hypothetical protein